MLVRFLMNLLTIYLNLKTAGSANRGSYRLCRGKPEERLTRLRFCLYGFNRVFFKWLEVWGKPQGCHKELLFPWRY